jgi:iron complex outermembrane recepter protein
MVLDYSGNDPAFAPHHLASLWVMKEFSSGFGLGLGGRYVGSHFSSEANNFEIDPYFTADVTASYRAARWKFSLHCKNVTDTEYLTRGFGSSSVTPARPFTAYARVDVLLGSR